MKIDTVKWNEQRAIGKERKKSKWTEIESMIRLHLCFNWTIQQEANWFLAPNSRKKKDRGPCFMWHFLLKALKEIVAEFIHSRDRQRRIRRRSRHGDTEPKQEPTEIACYVGHLIENDI